MSEAQDRIIWLHDGLKYSDTEIGEYLGIARESVCRIRKGVYGYSGQQFLDKLQGVFRGPDDIAYTYPQVPAPKPKPIPAPKFTSMQKCSFCANTRLSGSILYEGARQICCKECSTRMLASGGIE